MRLLEEMSTQGNHRRESLLASSSYHTASPKRVLEPITWPLSHIRWHSQAFGLTQYMSKSMPCNPCTAPCLDWLTKNATEPRVVYFWIVKNKRSPTHCRVR